MDAPNDISHYLWKIDEETSDYFQESFKNIDSTYVADGHHRAAAAFNVGKRRKERAIEAGKELTGEEDFNYFMTIIYPDDNLLILDYNRVLLTLNELSPAEFMEKMTGNGFIISEYEDQTQHKPTQRGIMSMLIEGKWHKIEIPDSLYGDDAVGSLDSTVLTELCLKDILGIENIRADDRVGFVGGMRGMEELEKRCNTDCVAAIALYACTIDQVFAVADAGQYMPPKTTWYEPKPRSGFVVNVYDSNE